MLLSCIGPASVLMKSAFSDFYLASQPSVDSSYLGEGAFSPWALRPALAARLCVKLHLATAMRAEVGCLSSPAL